MFTFKNRFKLYIIFILEFSLFKHVFIGRREPRVALAWALYSVNIKRKLNQNHFVSTLKS